jgi:hypothetical protein
LHPTTHSGGVSNLLSRSTGQPADHVPLRIPVIRQRVLDEEQHATAQVSRLRYRENATLLLEKAKALPPAELIALWQFLANNCSLVVIATPDLEAAYRIFSVLNNRGLDLAPIDIIKAQVLGLIRTTAGDIKSRAYAKEWSSIESALGRDAFGELFGHIRATYAKQKQRATLVKEFQEYVTEYKPPIDLVDKVIKPYAEVWDFVRDADFEATEHAETINEHLSWLNRVDFKDWVPPALVDAVLETTKDAVLERKKFLDTHKVARAIARMPSS